jgi:hypothetical protein
MPDRAPIPHPPPGALGASQQNVSRHVGVLAVQLDQVPPE